MEFRWIQQQGGPIPIATVASSYTASPGKSDDEGIPELAFMDGEQLEDDEELRMHIHGLNSFYSKWTPQCILIKKRTIKLI